MKNKLIKVLTMICMVASLFVISNTSISAAGISIGGVPGTIAPGGQFTVSVSIPGHLGGTVSLSCSNCSVVSQNPVMIDGSGSFTITAGSAGAASISAYAPDATNANDISAVSEASGSASFTIAAPVAPTPGGTPTPPTNEAPAGPAVEPEDDPRSKNNDLANLTVSEGTLTPAFTKETTEYSVNLPSTAKSIKIDAAVEDAKASVTGTGDINLEAGGNEINVVVRSEYGTEKIYKIMVNVDEKPLQFITYNGEKLGVVRNVKTATPPPGFSETKVKLDGKEIPAWKNETLKKTIVYMLDEKNNKNFYLFEDGKISTVFIAKQILGKDVYIIDVPENLQKRAGMKFGKIKIDNVELMGWTFTDQNFKNYKVIYVMDMDGKTRYYQYEEDQKTLQIYSNAAPITQKKYDSTVGEKQIWMYTAIGFIVVSIAAIAYIVFINVKKKKEN